MVVPLPAACGLSDDVSEDIRPRALHGCESGVSETDMAEILGVRRETVCRRWIALPGVVWTPSPTSGQAGLRVRTASSPTPELTGSSGCRRPAVPMN